jgi:acyl carrier protein
MLDKINKEIKKLVNDCVEEKINEETDLIQLGIDSLMTVELVLGLEEAFDIEFDDSDLEMENLKSVRDIVTLVNKYVVE